MSDTDVLIIGGGIMGAAIARLLREQRPAAEITIVDAGPPLGPVVGQHLHDVQDPQLWEAYNWAVSAGVQSLYVGAATRDHVAADIADVEPGMYFLSDFRDDAAAMPGAAIGWNGGGMGVHWTAATPWPYGFEVPAFIDAAQWAADLATAQRTLQVHPRPYGPSPEGDRVLEELATVFGPLSDPGRGPQAMPMAVTPDGAGYAERVGPGRIFPPLHTGDDPAFRHRAHTLCLAVLHDGQRATGARCRDLGTGEEYVVTADHVVVCADAMRTPQLLWASGIRSTALGRNLNEHAFLSGRVIVDLDRLGIDVGAIAPPWRGESVTGSYWLPHSGPRQPFQGQISTQPILADDLRTPVGLLTGLSWYVPFETHDGNYLEFSDDEHDLAGMPRITVHFAPTERDLATLETGRAGQRLAGDTLGDFDPDADSALLAAGSSLHYTGTVRMGPADDGTSVCDTDGRIWGMDNVYVAGNGVVPTPLACNSTLTGMITAVRAARALAVALESVK